MAITLLDIRQEVVSYLNDFLDFATATPSGRYDINTINLSINKSMHYYERQLNTFYQGYLSTIYNLDVLANISSYQLPSSFRSPVYEIRRTIDNYIYFLDTFTPYFQVLSTIPVANVSWVPTYWLEGNSINFAYPPTDDESSAVQIKYQKKLDDLSDDSSVLDDQLYDASSAIAMRATMRLLRAKDVSGALKNIVGWKDELGDEEKTFYSQVGKRYVKPMRPIPEASGSWDMMDF